LNLFRVLYNMGLNPKAAGHTAAYSKAGDAETEIG
jgi:hypothetical protein